MNVNHERYKRAGLHTLAFVRLIGYAIVTSLLKEEVDTYEREDWGVSHGTDSLNIR